jgi:hypothetical protein
MRRDDRRTWPIRRNSNHVVVHAAGIVLAHAQVQHGHVLEVGAVVDGHANRAGGQSLHREQALDVRQVAHTHTQPSPSSTIWRAYLSMTSTMPRAKRSWQR